MDTNRNEAPSPARHEGADSDKHHHKGGADSTGAAHTVVKDDGESGKHDGHDQTGGIHTDRVLNEAPDRP